MKQVRRIDLRPLKCGVISRCLEETPEEADRIVAGQIVRVLADRGLVDLGEPSTEPQSDGNRLPVLTNAEIMRECMSPEALAVKRNTRGILQ